MLPTNRCQNRYTHANRTCPVHPYSKPIRSADVVLHPAAALAGETNPAVISWLHNYRREREEKGATTSTPGKQPSPAADSPAFRWVTNSHWQNSLVCLISGCYTADSQAEED